MNNNRQDDGVAGLVCRGLSAQADTLDPQVAARLRRARVRAIETGRQAAAKGGISATIRQYAGRYRPVFAGPLWQGFAMAGLAAVLVTALLGQGELVSPGGLAIDSQIEGDSPMTNAMDVLMSNEDMEFLENLELYEWLAAEYG